MSNKHVKEGSIVEEVVGEDASSPGEESVPSEPKRFIETGNLAAGIWRLGGRI